MIVIKGMEMPNSGSECNLTTRKTWNYVCSINLKDIDCAETKRPKDCPLVEGDTCDDAISRKSMLDYLKYLHGEMPEEEFVKALPSVTSVRKLDQEPILDKIRADVIARYPKNYAGEPELGGNACEFSLNEILKILDKYKAEMESKE